MKPFSEIELVATAFSPAQFPQLKNASGQFIPHIALAGRSNVGKSSLINALTRSKIAKTSSVPGKTRSVNFYLIDQLFCLVDLPGYGYASTSKEEQREWSVLIDDYFKSQAPVVLCLLLIDARRGVQPLDTQFVNWMAPIPVRYVFTKVDCVSQQELDRLLAQYPAALPFSMKEGPLIQRFGKALYASAQTALNRP
jgi:GTP-binding protein